MSDDNRLSSQEEQFPLGYVTRDLVSHFTNLLGFVLLEDFRIKQFVSIQTNPELVQV